MKASSLLIPTAGGYGFSTASNERNAQILRRAENETIFAGKNKWARRRMRRAEQVAAGARLSVRGRIVDCFFS
jgi:hypothetical protein